MSADGPVQDQVAAADLGSNSFHMIIARVVGGEVHTLDRIREPVRLASGLSDDGTLSQEAQDRALECLQRFRERVGHMPSDRVRAVGTNTLRKASNSNRFLSRARDALGHRIDIIPGREEARLIYLGVAQTVSDDAGRRLVVDIGGGSTECIVGARFEPLETDSLYMGCVSYTRQYFPGGELNRDNIQAARIAARLEVRSIEKRYKLRGWDTAVGASGTINAIQTILTANGWTTEGITPGGLKKLRKAMVSAGKISKLSLPGLTGDRVPVIPGGVAILSAVFDGLGIQRMTGSSGALREGLVYDLLGRIRHEDVRDRTIQSFSDRYHVDVEQAGRVQQTAMLLLQEAWESWGIDPKQGRRMLDWAAQLHEIGLAMSFSGYHKHGAYLVSFSDMPGFSREDRQALAALIRSHRRKLDPEIFGQLSPRQADLARRLCVLLRLAVLLNRSRDFDTPDGLRLKVRDHAFELIFPRGWLEEHPLTEADLHREASHLKAIDVALSYR